MQMRLGRQMDIPLRVAAPAAAHRVSASLWARSVAWLKLARPRTWSFATAMFVFAYASTGKVSAWRMALGILVAMLLTGTTNVFNAWTDRREDAVNLPHRGQMIATLGAGTLQGSVVLGYLAVLTAGILAGPTYALLVFLGTLDSIFYSWGPRLKAHPIFSLLSFSGVVALAFISGWVMSEPFAAISPLIILLTYFFFAYGTIKNFPDAPGDKAAGVKTIYTVFSGRKAILIASALLFSPYLLLTLMLVGGQLGLEYLLCYLFVPVLGLIIRKKLGDSTVEQREATHALGYFYQISFFLVTLTVYYARPGTVVAAILMFLLCVLSDYYKVDSRPYDLRPGLLLGIGRRHMVVPSHVHAEADGD